jgi:hypothetical protein
MRSAAPVRSEVMSVGGRRLLRAGLAGAALTWAVLLLLTPGWSYRTAAGAGQGRAALAALVRVAGAHVCHQRSERSFYLYGRPVPVCGRCTGLYVAGATGLLAASSRRRRRDHLRSRIASPSWWPGGLDATAGILFMAAVPTALTWLLEVAGVWNPGTPLRAFAALPLGLTAGWLIGSALDE